jgi:hypothetical protein
LCSNGSMPCSLQPNAREILEKKENRCRSTPHNKTPDPIVPAGKHVWPISTSNTAVELSFNTIGLDILQNMRVDIPHPQKNSITTLKTLILSSAHRGVRLRPYLPSGIASHAYFVYSADTEVFVSVQTAQCLFKTYLSFVILTFTDPFLERVGGRSDIYIYIYILVGNTQTIIRSGNRIHTAPLEEQSHNSKNAHFELCPQEVCLTPYLPSGIASHVYILKWPREGRSVVLLMQLHRPGQWFSLSPEKLYFSSCDSVLIGVSHVRWGSGSGGGERKAGVRIYLSVD